MVRTVRRTGETYEVLGQEIAKARGKMRQQDLADRAGIADQTTLSDYERGRSRIPLDVLAAIEQALDLRRGELLVRAGIVAADIAPTSTGTEAAITSDPELDDVGRELLLNVLEFVRGKSVVNRFSDEEREEAAWRAERGERRIREARQATPS